MSMIEKQRRLEREYRSNLISKLIRRKSKIFSVAAKHRWKNGYLFLKTKLLIVPFGSAMFYKTALSWLDFMKSYRA